MGTERYYKPGSFYRICDRTGFATRAERTSTEWNNLIVRDDVYERRHPQDFVKGVQDNQTVPFARPRQPNVFVGTSTASQFEVYGDLPTGPTFSVQGGSIVVSKASAVVDPSKFPSGF
jgi:hypothetical protein